MHARFLGRMEEARDMAIDEEEQDAHYLTRTLLKMHEL